MTSLNHEHFMKRCLDLAVLGRSGVGSNPVVGACIVYKGHILAEAYHQRYGESHAEAIALDRIKSEDQNRLKESTLYVNLEPCNHHGKNPPCTEAIIRSGIGRVVVAMKDPNPLAHGGLARLQDAGIEVISGILEKEARTLNMAFLTSVYSKRPFITLKWAQSRDGFMGSTGRRMRISGPESDVFVHQMRAEYDAILIGSGTLFTDDPRLTTRLVPGTDPLRIIMAGRRKLPRESQLFSDGKPVMIFTNDTSSTTLINDMYHIDIKVYKKSIIELFSSLLHDQGIGRILVEGGQKILQYFIEEGLWDDAYVVTAPQALGAGIRSPELPMDNRMHSFALGKDEVHYFRSSNVKDVLK